LLLLFVQVVEQTDKKTIINKVRTEGVMPGV
jgi:hypothetical protein